MILVNNAILVNILLENLEHKNQRVYELSKKIPSFNNLTEFVQSRSTVSDQLNKITCTKCQKGNQSLTNKQSTLLVNSKEGVNKSFLKTLCFYVKKNNILHSNVFSS